jgi:hypothetical protein
MSRKAASHPLPEAERGLLEESVTSSRRTTLFAKNHRQMLWLGACLLLGGASACVGPDLEPPGGNAVGRGPSGPFMEAAGGAHSTDSTKAPAAGASAIGALNPATPTVGSGGTGASIPQQTPTTPPVTTTPASMMPSSSGAAGSQAASAAGAAAPGGALEDAGVEDGGRDAGTLRH